MARVVDRVALDLVAVLFEGIDQLSDLTGEFEEIVVCAELLVWAANSGWYSILTTSIVWHRSYMVATPFSLRALRRIDQSSVVAASV